MVTETKKAAASAKKSLNSDAIENWDERNDCIWAKVSPKALLRVCASSMANGAVFDSAFISSHSGGFTVHYLFRISGKMLVLQADGKDFSALSANVASALWDERKMQDLTGLKLKGIPDSRPLIFHPESENPDSHPVSNKPFSKPESRVYLIDGTGTEGEFEIAVGPVHAGIIEPGHFRFHAFGEQIKKMETRMFYLHRGVEKAVEGKSADEVLPMIESISGDESVANSVAYCHAVERALGLKVPERAEFIRAILMELERIYSHLADLGGMPTDVGFYLSASRFAVLREDMMRLNQQVSGNRFLRGLCTVGGLSGDLDKNKFSIILGALDAFTKGLDNVEQITFKSSTYLDRVFSTGTVSKRIAADLALVGPGARASGLSCDLRKTLPYSVYSKVPFSESIEKNGDVLSRFLVKIAEVRESAKIIKWLIAHMPTTGLRCDFKLSSGEHTGVGWSEAPRGGCTFFVELSDAGKIQRLACRTASFRNWRALEKAVEGNIVPDFPLINKSFNLSYAGADL